MGQGGGFFVKKATMLLVTLGRLYKRLPNDSLLAIQERRKSGVLTMAPGQKVKRENALRIALTSFFFLFLHVPSFFLLGKSTSQ